MEIPVDVEKLFPKLQSDIEIVDVQEKVVTIKIKRVASQRRRPLTTQVVSVPLAKDVSQRVLYSYIIDSLSSKMSRLVPFTFRNESMLNLAWHLYSNESRSKGSLIGYVYAVDRFCRWLGKTPDQIVSQCTLPNGVPNNEAIYQYQRHLDNYATELEIQGLASGTIDNYIKPVKTLFRTNNVPFNYLRRIRTRRKYKDRAPKPEELAQLIDIGEIRDKVIVSCLALGGFREGTLIQLKYYHVKHDLERNIIPIHVHVEAEITKGKYHDYDTFLGKEAVEYLKMFLNVRRMGTRYLPPETIHDHSPLIRAKDKVAHISVNQTYRIINRLYRKAGLLEKTGGRFYNLRAHSIRKFFRTQLAALGVPRDYIEYMMGHKVSTYHDIQMKGTEFLRNLYMASGLSIRPKTKATLVDMLKTIIRAYGQDPEKYLMRGTLAQPHRTLADPQRREQDIEILGKALRELLHEQILNGKAV